MIDTNYTNTISFMGKEVKQSIIQNIITENPGIWKIMLLNTVPNVNTNLMYSDVAQYEVSGGNYATGGYVLNNVSVGLDYTSIVCKPIEILNDVFLPFNFVTPAYMFYSVHNGIYKNIMVNTLREKMIVQKSDIIISGNTQNGKLIILSI